MICSLIIKEKRQREKIERRRERGKKEERKRRRRGDFVIKSDSFHKIDSYFFI
jgi:hypothetical protein